MHQSLLALLSAYLVGSIPTAYLLVRWLKRADVRTIGSGNVGATNVTRAAGWGAGALVFLLDAAKGLVAVAIIGRSLAPAISWWCGVCAVIGHVFPCWLRFRGGKGFATTLGLLLGAAPAVAAACGLAWALGYLVTRFSSVGSLVGAAAIPIAQWLLHAPDAELRVGIALALLLMVTHRSNILRLLQGREHRAGSGAAIDNGRDP